MSQLDTVSRPRGADCQLRVSIEGNEQTYSQTVSAGESVLIGSDTHCRLRINDRSVPERQCLLQFMQGEVYVHDWSSEHPTTVNGQPSDSSLPLTSKDDIRFGKFRVQLELTTVPAVASKGRTPSASATTAPADAPNRDETNAAMPVAERAAPPSLAAVADDEGYETPIASAPSTPRRTASYDARSVARNVTEAGNSIVDDDGWENLNVGQRERDWAKPPVDVSVQADTIELLTAEIESLQAELSEKNARLAESPYGTAFNQAAGEEASELEDRIEQLLAELEHEDERVSAVEESLRLCEETRRAELEEKRQLEQWVSDIEERIAARELEVHAECELLRQQLANADRERQQAEGQVSTLVGRSDSDAALQDVIHVLRSENESLRNKSHAVSQRLAELEKELAELRRSTTEEAIQQRIDEAVRAERLQLAQERAALSRKQLELSEKSNELSRQVERRGQSPADDRFRVFREQLKELHAQEKQEYVAPSMTQRLVKLWQKLDGPTDRD